MIDPKTLFPMIKKILPKEADADIMAGVQEFAKAHPDMDNAGALQALLGALKEMQGNKGGAQPQPAPAAPAQPSQPFGQGMLGALGSK